MSPSGTALTQEVAPSAILDDVEFHPGPGLDATDTGLDLPELCEIENIVVGYGYDADVRGEHRIAELLSGDLTRVRITRLALPGMRVDVYLHFRGLSRIEFREESD